MTPTITGTELRTHRGSYRVTDQNDNGRLDASDVITQQNTKNSPVSLAELQKVLQNDYGITKVKGLRLAPLEDYLETLASWHADIDSDKRSEISADEMVNVIEVGGKAGLSDADISAGLAAIHGELFVETLAGLTAQIKSSESADELDIDAAFKKLEAASDFYVDNISAKRAAQIEDIQKLPHDKQALRALINAQLAAAYRANATIISDKIKAAIKTNDGDLIYDQLAPKLAESAGFAVIFEAADDISDAELAVKTEAANKKYNTEIAAFADGLFKTEKVQFEKQLLTALAESDISGSGTAKDLNQAELIFSYYGHARSFAEDSSEEDFQKAKAKYCDELSTLCLKQAAQLKVRIDDITPPSRRSSMDEAYAIYRVRQPLADLADQYFQQAVEFRITSLSVFNEPKDDLENDLLYVAAILDVAANPDFKYRIPSDERRFIQTTLQAAKADGREVAKLEARYQTISQAY